jgi:hypothetical protein
MVSPSKDRTFFYSCIDLCACVAALLLNRNLQEKTKCFNQTIEKKMCPSLSPQPHQINSVQLQCLEFAYVLMYHRYKKGEQICANDHKKIWVNSL